MQRELSVGLILLACLGILQSCKKDKEEDPAPTDPISGPTPYVHDAPSWLLDSTGHAIQYPTDNPMTVEGIALGRMLFYETALSDDYSMSCGSCHKQEDGFSDARQFSVGTDGSLGTRQAMSTFNLLWDQFLFWDGRAPSMEAQAFGPVTNPVEMRNTWPTVEDRLRNDANYPALFEQAFGSPGIDSVRVVKAIAQFERTMLSLNSRFDRYRYLGETNALTPSEIEGYRVFKREAHCIDCHMEPLFVSHGMRNNGLDLVQTDLGLGGVDNNASHNGLFKVTTLRNIEVTAPYMHDGRFATLEEVVDFYNEEVQLGSPNLDNHMIPWVIAGGNLGLSEQQKSDLVAFMKALTDDEFLTNPEFSDPN
jgi:cytochrome c peroxidase